jgi:hypothetical protein
MPEYLSPGVYVEETTFRTKSIQGVSTSTAGFIGPTRTGPITGEPELLTSFADFERIYGGFTDLNFVDGGRMPNYVAHAVRAFFEEGGRRLYVMRVFNPNNPGEEAVNDFGLSEGIPTNHYGSVEVLDGAAADTSDTPNLQLVARFPGEAGNMRVRFTLNVGPNIFSPAPPPEEDEEEPSRPPSLGRARNHDIVLARTVDTSSEPPTIGPHGSSDGLFSVTRDNTTGIWTMAEGTTSIALDFDFSPPANFDVRVVKLNVEVERPGDAPLTFQPAEFLGTFSPDPRSSDALTETFARMPPTRFQALTIPFAIDDIADTADEAAMALLLVRQLIGAGDTGIGDMLEVENPTGAADFLLSGGTDGAMPGPLVYRGQGTGLEDYQNDQLQAPRNGLLAFEDVENISITAAPGYTAYGREGIERTLEQQRFAMQAELINHCEKMQYRVAVLDTPQNYLVSQAINFRNLRSSNYAAMYYPWIAVADPRPSRSGLTLLVPPSGHVAGMYARNDVENAVFKAPANMVVRTAVDFEQRLNKAQQDVLNPQGVNAFRFFEGRGFLLWGARTISDDSDWLYISVRRYFAYLEYSIDRGSQWAVFENNGPELWGRVRRMVENFLFNEWRAGGLLGNKPEEAYFVVCDRSTMTQQDLDQGRLICLVGVAPIKPAEFVIFRIGQFTADSRR